MVQLCVLVDVENGDQVEGVAHVLGGEDDAGGEVADDAGDGDRGLETNYKKQLEKKLSRFYV